MKTQSTLVRTDRAVHLNPESSVHMKITMIIAPGNAKDNHSFRFHDALQNFLVPILRVLFEHNRKGIEYFLDGLMKLRFGRVLRLHLSYQFCNIVSHGKVPCDWRRFA